MSAPRLALISLLLLTTSVAAEPLKLTEENGSPALEGQGTSSTTISVVGGTASVTVVLAMDPRDVETCAALP